MKLITFRLLLALMLVIPIAHGDDGIPWSYAWEGPDGANRELTLTLSTALAEKAFIGGGDLLHYDKISAVILSHTQRLAASLSDQMVTVTVTGDSLRELNFEAQPLGAFRGIAEARLAQITAFVTGSMEDVERATYYKYDPIRRSLDVNYNNIAGDYQSVVIETLIALSDSLGTGNRVTLRDELLGMLQSIPYTDLSTDDFPMLNPMRMLLEKRGDCESKQIFMAMAMKLLMPQSRVELIILPHQKHIVMRYQSDGEYVLMDATGPGRIAAGSIHPDFNLSGAIYYELVL
jgi:hypothetical protein